MTIYEILLLACKTAREGRKERKIDQNCPDRTAMMNQTYQDTQYIYRMSRTNDRTARRTAVNGQKGPLFVVADDNDNSYYDWSLQP